MGEELWYVKLADGDVHRVTIDQLDGAFQAGHIDENTMVLAAGATQWTKLGELAGLGDEAEAPPPAPAAPATYAAPARVASQAVPSYAPPAHAQGAAAARAAVPVSYASYAPAGSTPYAVTVTSRPAAVPPLVPNSLRPMSLDLGELDLDMPYQRKSRAGRFVVAVIGLAAIAGGVGFAAQRAHFGFGGGTDLSNVAAAAAVAAPPPADPVVAAPQPVTPPPTQWAPAASPSPANAGSPAANAGGDSASPMNPQFTSRFNEDTKLKLLSADKARDAKAKSRHSGGGAAPSSGHTKSTTFTTGGNKFDPLNSAI
jgi:hypothetical protein